MKCLKTDRGERVSCIGIGCMRIAGMSGSEIDTLVHAALDEGINFFDHADIYGGGRSEEIFGAFLEENRGLREKMFLQSKCAIHDGMYDFSGDYIRKSVDGILKRLKVEYIDSLLLHRSGCHRLCLASALSRPHAGGPWNDQSGQGKERGKGFRNSADKERVVRSLQSGGECTSLKRVRQAAFLPGSGAGGRTEKIS